MQVTKEYVLGNGRVGIATGLDLRTGNVSILLTEGQQMPIGADRPIKELSDGREITSISFKNEEGLNVLLEAILKAKEILLQDRKNAGL